MIEHVTGRAEQGPEGYCEFARRWLEAFPDATLSVEGVRQRGDSIYDVDPIATGTHTGTLCFESRVFRPTGLRVRLSARELLQVEGRRFQSASLSFDLQDLGRQLARIDAAKLLEHIAPIQCLGDQLRAAEADPT